ncbi:hypothetical protein [Hufsiella ginkgonis]|uniref:Entericidin n=1 Tax=Hufsiella ginkgonis TaxID=2695274 RepID=A0A7K1XRX0_9SPHI|nr:hypothetical protein [Hufsiella ginkgonis]MXV13735.1 hypothetical protein [Hufsiella ginkgonis]
MKKLFALLAVAGFFLGACNGGPSAEEKEKQDSIAASKTADSLLNAVAADSTAADAAKTDSLAADSTK